MRSENNIFSNEDERLRQEATRRQAAVRDGRPVVVVAPIPQPPSGPVCTLISGHYNACDDGTVTDTNTKLMWKRCAEGQTWTGSTCSGEGTGMIWDEAMPNAQQKTWDAFAGYSDWQVPTREQLRTLVWCSNGTPQEEAWGNWCSGEDRRNGSNYQRPTIDLKAFPNAESMGFWSASSVASDSTGAWFLDFNGGDDWGYRSDAARVRLVRVGQ